MLAWLEPRAPWLVSRLKLLDPDVSRDTPDLPFELASAGGYGLKVLLVSDSRVAGGAYQPAQLVGGPPLSQPSGVSQLRDTAASAGLFEI